MKESGLSKDALLQLKRLSLQPCDFQKPELMLIAALHLNLLLRLWTGHCYNPTPVSPSRRAVAAKSHEAARPQEGSTQTENVPPNSPPGLELCGRTETRGG